MFKLAVNDYKNTRLVFDCSATLLSFLDDVVVYLNEQQTEAISMIFANYCLVLYADTK